MSAWDDQDDDDNIWGSESDVEVESEGEGGANFAVFAALQAISPELEIVGEDAQNSLMLAAMSMLTLLRLPAEAAVGPGRDES